MRQDADGFLREVITVEVSEEEAYAITPDSINGRMKTPEPNIDLRRSPSGFEFRAYTPLEIERTSNIPLISIKNHSDNVQVHDWPLLMQVVMISCLKISSSLGSSPHHAANARPVTALSCSINCYGEYVSSSITGLNL
jgi:hypothetical protein